MVMFRGSPTFSTALARGSLRPAIYARPVSSTIDKDHPDYTVYSGDWDVCRIYQPLGGGPDSMRWFWSMTVNGLDLGTLGRSRWRILARGMPGRRWGFRRR